MLLWGDAANIHRIFVLQKRDVRAIYKLGPTRVVSVLRCGGALGSCGAVRSVNTGGGGRRAAGRGARADRPPPSPGPGPAPPAAAPGSIRLSNEEGWIPVAHPDGGGPPELSLTGRNKVQKLLLHIYILWECGIPPVQPAYLRAADKLTIAPVF
ncbi:hypothetical protein EVAR_95068_1 [Eumeta japonica]|uniref:Uncharacterized protein n=1 Tax=Eumeta variegata TaxID=151549 RepID=A0A4C1W523_EUMVA|nr:hypothetical protein EVAR_95068_1 [Eumeta japonica]